MRVLSVIILSGCLFLGCGPAPSSAPPVRSGDYLGETPPGIEPVLSADGRFLFFSSRRTPEDAAQPSSYRGLVDSLTQPLNGSMNLYWVDASILDSLRED